MEKTSKDKWFGIFAIFITSLLSVITTLFFIAQSTIWTNQTAIIKINEQMKGEKLYQQTMFSTHRDLHEDIDKRYIYMQGVDQGQSGKISDIEKEIIKIESKIDAQLEY